MPDPYKKETCHDCLCEEGRLHERGCDMERCPFCGGQLISCGCCYTKLGYGYDFDKEHCGLPEKIYEHGLGNVESERWEEMLRVKGRVPYIQWPIICAYCGTLWPEFFQVEDEVWEKYIQANMRGRIVCKKCWDFIVGLQTEGKGGIDDPKGRVETD